MYVKNSFSENISEEQMVVGNAERIDSKEYFFSVIADSGVEIRCKSIEDFRKNFLNYDHETNLYTVNQMSNIYHSLPDFDCQGCNAIPLHSKNKISDVVGYFIYGVARKWDSTKEPWQEIEAQNVKFSIGDKKGIPTGNLRKHTNGRAFTTDSHDVFRILMKFNECVIYDPSNDSGFLTLNEQLDENTFVVMIGDHKPKLNQDLFIHFDVSEADDDKQRYKNIIEQVNYIQRIEDERLLNISQEPIIETTIPSKSALIVRTLNQIEEKPTDWIWDGWLAARKITVLAGMGGCGKTNLMLSIAATISIGGIFPDGSKCKAAGKVLIYSTEDAADDTLKPRIMSYDADLANIAVMDGVIDKKGKVKSFGIEDITALEDYAKANPELRLLIIDPVVGLVQGDLNKANTVRQALDPLSKFAEDYNCAVVCITHLSKSAGKENMPLVERFLGSQAFTAKARMALCAVKDENENSFYLSRVKTNTTKQSDTHMRYMIESAIVGKGIETSKTTWLEPFTGSFDTKSEARKEKLTEFNRAKNLILELFSKNETIAAKHLKSICLEVGISNATCGRAMRDLGVENYKIKNAWYLKRPVEIVK